MAIVSHRFRFIFLKTRKTAGSSIELWLARYLDPKSDVAWITSDLDRADPTLAAQFYPGQKLIKAHATAREIMNFVGPDVWRSYYKFSVERDPWDRLISLWSWRVKERKVNVSLGDFIDAIESSSPARIRAHAAQYWSNWPIYTLADQIVADEVILYENLMEGISKCMARIGLPFDGQLPRAKAGIRSPAHTVDMLDGRQVEQIARLFHREIQAFGYGKKPRA